MGGAARNPHWNFDQRQMNLNYNIPLRNQYCLHMLESIVNKLATLKFPIFLHSNLQLYKIRDATCQKQKKILRFVLLSDQHNGYGGYSHQSQSTHLEDENNQMTNELADKVKALKSVRLHSTVSYTTRPHLRTHHNSLFFILFLYFYVQ